MAAMKILQICTIAVLILSLSSISDAANCVVPRQFQGDWFSMEIGDDTDTLINHEMLDKRQSGVAKFEGYCHALWNDNSTIDSDGNHDSKIVFYDAKISGCYTCFQMLYRTPNIIQYRFSTCITAVTPPTLEQICQDIDPNSAVDTYFRKTPVTVNCKNTFEGYYTFTYEWNYGGGGICDSPYSKIKACQIPGSRMIDNQVFRMSFGPCPGISSSISRDIKFQCMGTWEDDRGNVWSALKDHGRDLDRERFRCMLTRLDQEERNNKFRYTMSWWAQCNTLKSPYEGPMRLYLEPALDPNPDDAPPVTMVPHCMLPDDYFGTWYTSDEYDVDVTINATHIYFKTKIDQFWYKESYFVCQMTVGTRYLMTALTVGKCEVDSVCFDFLPRHHSIIRWRMGRPFRLSGEDTSRPNYREYMFNQACTWSSFTLNRNDVKWKYKTFLLNPPAPVPCPVQGRYTFTQHGPPEEHYYTRIRGITERPRHQINCRQYVTEYKSCLGTEQKSYVDAEYCETVDHTGRPIGEYDEADRELTCVGFWDEDLRSYMVTYDSEDPVSFFRCWIYERTDWRHIVMSRSTKATCGELQTARSSTAAEGASLALKLEEAERLFDDCPQRYIDSHPYNNQVEIITRNAASLTKTSAILWTILLLCSCLLV